MEIMKSIILDSIPLWEECLNTDFIKALATNTLDDDKMTKYIVEDTTYLTEYAKCFAYQIAKCKTLEQMRFFYNILGFVNESETSVRRVFLQERNIDEEWAETRKPDLASSEYINHMLNYCKNGSVLEGLMATFPCMLSYEYIFMKLHKLYPSLLENRYKDILTSYVDPGYTDVCNRWIAYAEKLIKNQDEASINHLMDIFRKSSEYELAFWKMSYDNKL